MSVRLLSYGIVALVVSKSANSPGHPAFGGEYRAQVYTPGNVHVIKGHIESRISNGGVPYTDPSGSGDTITPQAVPPLLNCGGR